MICQYLRPLPASSQLDFSEPARVPKGCATNAPNSIRVTAYNWNVRYYTTEPMNGGITFKCVSCEHRVSTLDFNTANGNRRTQAAKAMNQHSAESHVPAPRASSPSYPDSRNRF